MSDDIFYIKTSIQFMSDKLDDLYQLKPEIRSILKLVTKLKLVIEQKDEVKKTLKPCKGLRII